MKIKKITRNEPQIICSTWQSVYDIMEEDKHYFKQFGAFIGDECHLSSGSSIQGIGKALINATDRIGLTGTMKDLQLSSLQIQGIFGPVKNIVKTHQLIAGGMATPVKIYACINKYSDAEKKTVPKDYHKEMDFIVTHKKRNQVVCNMANSTKGNTLVLFQFVEKHGKVIYETLKAMSNKKIYYIHGGVDSEDRNEIRRILEVEDDCVVVASYGTTSTGWSVRNLHNVILASPSKSKVRVLQSIGRGLRKHSSKSVVKIFDIGDDLSKNGDANYTLDHMRERIKYYYGEKLPVTYKMIELG